LIALIVILHGLTPSSFSEHLSLNGDLIHGSHASLCQSIFLVASLLTLGVSQSFLKKKEVLHFEYVALILFSLLGLSIISVSSNLAMIYLAIELQSLAFYVLATIGWNSDFNVEAGIKYFVIGSFSSCLLLFGFALMYLNTGSLSFEAIQKIYTESDKISIVFYSICFSSAALLFKVGAAPFHNWLCDVYEGSLTSVTLFFAVVPKIVLFYLLFKLFFYALIAQKDIWTGIMLGSGVLSIVVASVGALVQKKVKKRLLAFSFCCFTHRISFASG
jgi:NADH-quinone oxidoreductase subunit N